MKNFKTYYRKLIIQALKEDIGRGDITTDSIFQNRDERNIEAFLLAKEDLILCGSELFQETLRITSRNKKINFKWHKTDGQLVKKGRKICTFKGNVKSILKGERVALNILQRLSGIATLTRKHIDRLNDKKIRITDTRKTTPLLRPLEKYAVKVGGGLNHRMGLFDRILIKDNHIDAAGSIEESINRAKRKRPLKDIEVEVKNLAEVKEAVKANAGIIMLDNMNVKMIRDAVKIIGNCAKIEISGNVDLNKIARYRKLKVDYISIGALTHSFKSSDISLRFKG